MGYINYKRNNTEACVISALIKGGEKVKQLCVVRNIKPSHFSDSGARMIYENLISGKELPKFHTLYRNAISNPNNARFYIDGLLEHVAKGG